MTQVYAFFCRWCQYRRVSAAGDVCAVCADKVEASGQAFRRRYDFRSDCGFPWVRLLVWALVAAIVLGAAMLVVK